MKRFFAILAVVVAMPLAAIGQAADAIEDVIGDQLAAFNDRDVPRAFSHASPMIKRLFGNPGNFGTMVERGYPMVWDNREIRFLERAEIEGQFFQKVLLRGPQGNLHVIMYKMIETPTGWQIDGVELLEAPDVGV